MFVSKKQVSLIRKYHNRILQTNPWPGEGEPDDQNLTIKKQSKATSSLFPNKMIAKRTRTDAHRPVGSNYRFGGTDGGGGAQL